MKQGLQQGLEKPFKGFLIGLVQEFDPSDGDDYQISLNTQSKEDNHQTPLPLGSQTKNPDHSTEEWKASVNDLDIDAINVSDESIKTINEYSQLEREMPDTEEYEDSRPLLNEDMS
jgi:hypothetical protein